VLLGALEAAGLLLLQDTVLPSAAALVAGEPIAGSWWADPRSHEIFREVSALSEHPDVLATKLVGGKVTFVHRRLWGAVRAVATGREPWQSAGLSPEARALWGRVEREGSLVASGAPAREVELRLLAHGEQVHTEAGRHETRLETWTAWARRAGCRGPELSAAEGRARLEAVVVELGGTATSLPWQAKAAKRPRRGG
jgi:hypothetical protein